MNYECVERIRGQTKRSKTYTCSIGRYKKVADKHYRGDRNLRLKFRIRFQLKILPENFMYKLKSYIQTENVDMPN